MTSTEPLLRRIEPQDLLCVRRSAIDPSVLSDARAIVEDVRARGIAAVRDYSERFGERNPDDPLCLNRVTLDAAVLGMDADTLELLRRVRGRIDRFARAQRDSVTDLDLPIPGGRAGHRAVPVESAGCYAPGGRHPLPSSVLMTAVTARAAGCNRVVVASPSAEPIMLAAAAIAGADEFLCVGGAHAIAALAYGFHGFSPCDVVVGPGNKWVTAAKHIVSDTVGIDMLAGPSELLILADDSADPKTVAADLLGQAEHDDDAVPMLVTTSMQLAEAVENEIRSQLLTLPTAATAWQSLRNGFVCVVDSLDEACRVSDGLAAEHVEVMTRNAEEVASRLRHAGAIFLGSASAEVFGDYGAGPNHTLPTGGVARYSAGLSVMNFLRLRTWLRIDEVSDAGSLIDDAALLAHAEGLEAHRRSARIRVDRGGYSQMH